MLYKEQDAKLYTRVCDIIINNPHEGMGLHPSIRFNEEYAVVELDGTVKPQGPAGLCMQEFRADNATTPFDLLHPETGAVIGSATFQDLQVMLFSLYFHTATERDNAPVEPGSTNPDVFDPITGG